MATLNESMPIASKKQDMQNYETKYYFSTIKVKIILRTLLPGE